MSEFKIGDIVVIHTSENDLSTLNGRKCEIVSELDENGFYTVKLLEPEIPVFEFEIERCEE